MKIVRQHGTNLQLTLAQSDDRIIVADANPYAKHSIMSGDEDSIIALIYLTWSDQWLGAQYSTAHSTPDRVIYTTESGSHHSECQIHPQAKLLKSCHASAKEPQTIPAKCTSEEATHSKHSIYPCTWVCVLAHPILNLRHLCV